MKHSKNPRVVALQTWRGPGAKGGWHVRAIVVSAAGDFHESINARDVLAEFRSGASVGAIAKEQGLLAADIEQILRLMMKREGRR
jgi:hypothetical protein